MRVPRFLSVRVARLSNRPGYLEERRATFTPERTDDLQPAALAAVGTTTTWRYDGLVEDGPYKGERRWTHHDWDEPFIGWSPERDLTFVEPGQIE